MDLPIGKALWKPFAVLGAAAAYLTLRWDAIPQTWAIHWDLAGRADGWAQRTTLGVYGLVALGASIVVFTEVVAVLASRRERDAMPNPVHAAALSTARTVNLATSLLLAFLAVDLPLGPHLPPLAIASLSLGIVGAAIAIGTVRLSRARNRAPRLGTKESLDGYHGLFYSQANDVRLWVPKRYGVGWTVNFAHPLAWPTMLLLVGVPIVLAIVSSLSTHGR